MTSDKERYFAWVKRIGRMPENRNADPEKQVISEISRRQMQHTAYPSQRGKTDD